MDLFVFPSYTEQFPITILEAMAHSLPIVSTDVGAVRDALPGQNLLSPGDHEGLTNAIVGLYTAREKRINLGDINRMHFQENFQDEVLSEQWRITVKSLFDSELNNHKAISKQ